MTENITLTPFCYIYSPVLKACKRNCRIKFVMCVDDYEFRHFSARRDKVCRKFIIVNEEEFARTFYVNISQFEELGHVALCKILIYLSTKGLVIQAKKFYIPKFNAIIEPYTFCRIQFQALDETDILMKTYPITKETSDIFAENDGLEQEYEEETGHSDENYYCRFEEIEAMEEVYELIEEHEDKGKVEALMKPEEPEQEMMIDEAEIEEHNTVEKSDKSEESHKKTKQSERGIGQVIQAVKVWRQLHETKRCNLTNAAKVVGISKKSLDDYFLVLRVGQILGFDYPNNLDKKMGDLRNFIRSREQKVTGKLGKNVNCFKLVGDLDLDRLMLDHQNGAPHPF